MKNISKEQYEFANNRMEELLKKMTEDTPDNDPLMLELDIVSDIVEQYETEHFPIPVPTLGAIISDALRDAGMTGKELAKKLGISPSRVSDYINNKTEPSLRIASSMCSILDIKPFEIMSKKKKKRRQQTIDDFYPLHEEPMNAVEEWDNLMNNYYEYCAD